MSTETREAPSQAPRPSSPSRESTFSGLVDPAAAKMRILVAPYYSPYVVSVDKVQTWEGLILMLQRLFGPTFCSLSTPPKITLHRTEELVTTNNWTSIVSADCCIVVHTKSEETGSSDTSPRPATSGSLSGKGKPTPIKAGGTGNNTVISSPTATPRDPRARLINRHANSGFETPNIFDGGNYTTGAPEEPAKTKQKKRKRKGSWWDSLLTAISSAVHLSSRSRHAARPQQPQPMGTSTHIAAMERSTSKKLRQSRRVKGKRVSRVIVQSSTATGRPVSMVRTPVKPRFSSGNALGGSRKRSTKNKRRSIPPHHAQKSVRRHMGRSHSDCSSCFCDDDGKRDSLIIAARQVGGSKQPVVTTMAAPASPPFSRSSPQLKSIAIGPTILSRSEKTDSFTIFTSPIIEEFSLQPKKKARPPSSAAATKTSSVYYEATPPPIPKRSDEDETGFHAQFRLLDEHTVRTVVKKAAAMKKQEEQKESAQSQSSRTSQSSRSSTAAPKRSNSMGHALTSSPTPSGPKRSGTTSQPTPSKHSAANITIDPHYKEKHASTSSKAGTVNSAGSRSSSSMGFRRQSTPFDNKPLPRLPGDHSTTSSIDMKHNAVSPTGAIVMPPIATFEDLMSKTTASSIAEAAEGGSIKDVTMVAGQS